MRPSVISAGLTGLALAALLWSLIHVGAPLFGTVITAAAVALVWLALERFVFPLWEGRRAPAARAHRPDALGWTIALVPPALLALCAVATWRQGTSELAWAVAPGALWLATMLSLVVEPRGRLHEP